MSSQSPEEQRRNRSKSPDFSDERRSRDENYDGGNDRHTGRRRDSSNKENVDKKIDSNLPQLEDDPRRKDRHGKVTKGFKGGGRNTESFDPASTLVRPDMRIIIGPNRPELGKTVKHDDVIVVPEFICKEDDWSLYYQLVEEMREIQARGEKKSEWISWHEGAHLISQNPTGSKTFQMIQEKISNYFDIPQKSVGTRFNWYKDSSDWKPFHHDSAAFNPQRARNQNITVGVSLGSTRELAFLNAANGTKIYFPQTNGMMFSFGRDVNIKWKHGINALPADEQDGRGRISIILWGNCQLTKDEDNSPPMLTDNTRGNGHSIHSNNNSNSNNIKGRDRSGRDRSRDRDRDPRDRSRDRDRDPHDRSRDRNTRDRSRDRNTRDRDSNRERTSRSRDRGSAGHKGSRRDNDRSRSRSHERHERSSGSRGKAGAEVCRDFSRGSCRFGDRCRYSHSDASR